MYNFHTNTQQWLDISLLFSSFFTLTGSILTLVTKVDAYKVRWKSQYEWAQILVTIASTTLICLGFSEPGPVVVIASGTMVLALAVQRSLPWLSAAGVAYVVVAPIGSLAGGLWMIFWLRQQSYPEWLWIGASVAMVLSFLRMILVVAMRVGTFALLTRKVWTRPIAPLPPRNGPEEVRVSLHVPTHCEPPDLVINTLDHLARLHYENYEVIICDNNTLDEQLWRPVEAHCRRLNAASGKEQFRFLHVEGLQGAKAGALNLCLDHTDPGAELVAVVDADYLAEPDFLSRLVGFFVDPRFAFVQTSHDYRSDDASLFKRACYWEYVAPNRLEYAGASEMRASFTVGTMCIFRRSAIEAVGRWAEWCQTEDSEIAIRLRAAGYDGVFLPYTFGRGLIPDNYADWKRQRFRWTSGPMQQFRRHWRLFLPSRFGGSPHLSRWGKLFEVFRSVVPLTIPMTIAGNVAFAILLPIMVMLDITPQLSVPPVAVLGLSVVMAASVVRTVAEYRVCGCCRLRDVLSAEFAALALSHVCGMAAITAALGGKIVWLRTPKFNSRSSLRNALASVRVELSIALALVVIAITIAFAFETVNLHGKLVALGALVYPLLSFVAAVAMALLALARRPDTGTQAFIDKRAISDQRGNTGTPPSP